MRQSSIPEKSNHWLKNESDGYTSGAAKVFFWKVANRLEEGGMRAMSAIGEWIRKSRESFPFESLERSVRISMATRYGMALIAVLISFALRFALDSFLGSYAPFILFVPAILLAGVHGGIGPFLLASLISLTLASRFFGLVMVSWIPSDVYELVAALTYLFSAAAIVALIDSVRSRTQVFQNEVEQRQHVEEELRNKQEKLQAIADNSPTMLFIKDTEGRYLFCNRHFEIITHKPEREVIGKTDAELFPKELADVYCANDRKVMETGVAWEFEESAVHGDGPRVSIVHKFPLRNPTGKIYAMGGVATDITRRKQTEESLRRSEELLRMTTEGAEVDLWNWDAATDSLECSGIRRWMGIGHSIPSQVYFNHIHPDDRVQVRREFRSCLRGNREFNVEFRVTNPDGRLVWKHSKGRPFYANGRPVRFSGLSLDITARKQAEEALRRSEELLRMTTEGANIGLWSWWIPNDLLEWNAIEYQQFGLSVDAPLSLKTFLDCIHPEDRAWVNTELESCLRENRELSIKHRILRADGSIRWNHCKGRLTYSDGRPVRFSGMSLDITEQKKMEENLQQVQNALAAHARQLEQRVAERTEQLNKSVQDMEGFCYSIAHDLRAPLRAMRGFVYALTEDYGSKLGGSALLYCDRIQVASNRMDELISDLLAFGRLSHLELPTTLVDLNAEIEKVLGHFSEELEKKRAEIKLDKPLPAVRADAPVLDQVLENLIANAVKFVPPGKPPRVHIYAEPHENNVRVWVEDNGIGIAPEHQKKIFGAFERLHPTETYPGTGIGLAIVQRGVEKMGGHVGIESEVGKGSRFWIELPKANASNERLAKM